MARVLVVDDDELIRRASQKMIGEFLGHHVVIAPNGGTALGEIRKGQFDVILTDLNLPDIDGWLVAYYAKTIAPHIRVGLISGYDTGLSAKDLKTRGIDFVLSKPFSLDDLETEFAIFAGNEKGNA